MGLCEVDHGFDKVSKTTWELQCGSFVHGRSFRAFRAGVLRVGILASWFHSLSFNSSISPASIRTEIL